MIFGMVQIRTNQPSETIFKTIPDICNSINANLEYTDEANYYIYARLKKSNQILFDWGFHMFLKREKKDTEIDLFVEYEGLFQPSRKFIQTLLDALKKRIPIKNAIAPIDWRFYEIEKTENGLIKIDGNKEDLKGSLKKKILQAVIEFRYDVKPLGNYTNQITKKIEKLFILIGETNEIQLKKDDNSPPMFIVPYDNIKKVETIKYDKGLLHLAEFVLSITFHQINYITSDFSSIKDLFEQELDHTLILDTKKGRDTTAIVAQISAMLECRENRKKKLQLLASLQGTTLCSNCCINLISFSFSFEKICRSCFFKKYGKILLAVHNGEYHGGHKVYLTGGKFSECEYGELYLTDKSFIFHKIYQEHEKKQNWEIIIPFDSIQIEQWGLQEGSRRKNILLGGPSGESYGLGGGFIHESGKRHRLVIPYVDENGIKHVPIFGISSRKGDLIKIWASTLYEVIVKNIKNHAKEEIIPVSNKVSTSDPLVILKTRFAKGEISKAEFEEMKRLLE